MKIKINPICYLYMNTKSTISVLVRHGCAYRLYQVYVNNLRLYHIRNQIKKKANSWNTIIILSMYFLFLGTRETETLGILKGINLTGGNWQKWKRVFLTCPCHKIYRDEAVGLKSCKNTWKITIFVKMWNLGPYRENLIFCQ